MNTGAKTETALNHLKVAMASSVELMNREYYAMRLVIEAKRYTDYPDELKEIELSKEDQALSPEEKMQRASVMVHDEEYYVQKNLIREDMRASLDELEIMAYDTDASALSSLGKEMAFVRLVIAFSAD